jgi:hypothetical protein
MSKSKRPTDCPPSAVRRHVVPAAFSHALYDSQGRRERESKTVWLRAYCAAIESFVPKEAADIADAAVKAFSKRFYGCS